MARPLALVVLGGGGGYSVCLYQYEYGNRLEANQEVRARCISHDGEELSKAVSV